MTEVDHNKLIKQTYKLALEGKHITVPYLQKELEIGDELTARTVIEVLVRKGKIIYVELEGERFWMVTSKLKANFGMPDYPEKDEKLIKLISSAQKDLVPAYKAIVDIKKIKPFCEYKPKKKDFKKQKKFIVRNIAKGDPPSLHVYQEGEYFIMSDDYNSYFNYLDQGFSEVPCIIFGKTNIEGLVNKREIKYH